MKKFIILFGSLLFINGCGVDESTESSFNAKGNTKEKTEISNQNKNDENIEVQQEEISNQNKNDENIETQQEETSNKNKNDENIETQQEDKKDINNSSNENKETPQKEKINQNSDIESENKSFDDDTNKYKIIDLPEAEKIKENNINYSLYNNFTFNTSISDEEGQNIINNYIEKFNNIKEQIKSEFKKHRKNTQQEYLKHYNEIYSAFKENKNSIRDNCINNIREDYCNTLIAQRERILSSLTKLNKQFSEYNNILNNDEKEQLDKFLKQLKNNVISIQKQFEDHNNKKGRT